MAEAVNDSASSFVIRELSGDKRTLTLRERALPYRPFELSGTQRKSIEWYPGSPIGTLQVFGAKEEPTTINGQWKDAFLGSFSSGSAPAQLSTGATFGFDNVDGIAELTSTRARRDGLRTVRELTKLVDDMRRKGQEVEVTWLDQARRGIIDRFTVRWHTGHDVEWELAFEWISQAESLSDIPLSSGQTDLGDIASKIQDAVDGLTTDAAELVPQAGDSYASAATSLNDIGANIQAFTDSLNDAVVNAAQAISGPMDGLRRVAGILDGIKLEADFLSNYAEEFADGIALDGGELSAINPFKHSFGEILAQRGKVRDQSTSAVEVRNIAARQQQGLLNAITSDVIKVFQAREGQDLRQVSQTYYGTPDEWRGLMIYNHLTESGLNAGQVVFVPSQPPSGNC